MSTSATGGAAMPAAAPSRRGGLALKLLGILVVLAALVILPTLVNDYWVHIATLAGVYWILVAGLDLVVGYAGQLAVGYVGLLAIGAYTSSILCDRVGLDPFTGLVASGLSGALFGFLVGLPSLRLKHFYFAMATLGFATIVSQIALAWGSLTGGGIGLLAPVFPAPLDSQTGFYFLVLALAALATYLVSNVAHSTLGRGLVAIRDAEVAAEATGVSIFRLKLGIFTFSGGLAGVAGALFATAQTYITPDAFTFDLSVLFFIAVLVGGRGRVLGPLIGTIVLTLLPEFAAPLVKWSTFVYALLLLLVVLLVPGGIADFLERLMGRPGEIDRLGEPRPERVATVLGVDAGGEKVPGARRGAAPPVVLEGVIKAFGGVRALDGLDLELRPATVHGLIGPNGSGKTTALNIISGFYPVDGGSIRLGDQDITTASVQQRARLGIARTFQAPRTVGEISVIENVMLGRYMSARASFGEIAAGVGRYHQDEREQRALALAALEAVGLRDWADARADRLQHSELRFLEIARCLAMRPDFILLDEPAAGLSVAEIDYLADLVAEMRRLGMGVLLVEHHAELIFKISDAVTVLEFGRVLAHDLPERIRVHKDVVNAYLGA